MATPIIFYFDFVSAYSYVAMNNIEALAKRWGREVEWVCVSLPAVLSHRNAVSPREQPAKFAHNMKDFPRLCEINNLPVNFPPEVPPYGATLHRLMFWRLNRKNPELAKDFAKAIDHRYFGTGKEVRTASQLASACKARGVAVSIKEIQAAEKDKKAHKALDAAFDRAIKDGMFGAPFMVLDGETFWGADRLDHLEYRLKNSVKVPRGFEKFSFTSPFTTLNGPLFVKCGKQKAVFGFRVAAHHLNPRNVVHGGWMTSFVDVAMAQSALYELGVVALTPTIHLDADFLAPIYPGQWVECDVRLVKTTRTMNFVEAVSYADGEPVLRSSAIYRKPRDMQERVGMNLSPTG
ncbi:MAG: DsbA family protein [Alphaproteobacteria bacterium]|nr:DsbA family protein [Alphaproteobacteria bacterium]